MSCPSCGKEFDQHYFHDLVNCVVREAQDKEYYEQNMREAMADMATKAKINYVLEKKLENIETALMERSE